MADSRAATNALLADLREGNLAPAAVVRFLGHAARRSLLQAVRRPRDLAELTALHGILFAVAAGRRPGRRWVTASWVLAVLHLGLLEHRTCLTTADTVTLLRADLPALPGGTGRVSGVLAIGLDLADGHLARHQRTASPFGEYADTPPDSVREVPPSPTPYWTWLTLRHEPSRAVRMAAVVAWALPVVTVTGLALRRGTMPERPPPSCCDRPPPFRPSSPSDTSPAADHLGHCLPSAGCSGSGASATRTPWQNATWSLIFRARGLGLG